MSSTYTINEIFYSIQGEGVRAGTANVFVRFTGCNMRCDVEPGPQSPGGFACDTEFASGRKMTLDEILEFAGKIAPTCRWLILTGGEPALQVDREFCEFFGKVGYQLAIETNGSVALGDGLGELPLDWVTVSPKVAEHCIKQLKASEVKYVRGLGQGIPKTVVVADHYLISPAFGGNALDREVLDWCIKLCLENPEWRLSVQQHKKWGVR